MRGWGLRLGFGGSSAGEITSAPDEGINHGEAAAERRSRPPDQPDARERSAPLTCSRGSVGSELVWYSPPTPPCLLFHPKSVRCRPRR